MSELAAEHPENAPIAQEMRGVQYVREVRWLYDQTYKIHFDVSVPTAEIERFLAAHGVTPTAQQVPGNNLVIHPKTGSEEDGEEVSADE